MQSVTPELAAILKDAFQAGAQGFRGRVELDRVTLASTAPGEPANQALVGTVTDGGGDLPWDGQPEWANDGNYSTPAISNSRVVGGGTHHAYLVLDCGADVTTDHMVIQGGGGFSGVDLIDWDVSWSDDGLAWTLVTILTRVNVYPVSGRDGQEHTVTYAPLTHRYWRLEYVRVLPDGLYFQGRLNVFEWSVHGTRVEAIDSFVTTVDLPQPSAIAIDKSLRMAADQAEVTIPNPALLLAWAPENLPTNLRLRIWQWYGEDANELRTFTGVLDRVHQSRDLLEVVLSARDMFAVLIDQTFSTFAPQSLGEAGAARTEANGVYLNREVSYIVAAILDRASWPADDRAITPTSYVLDEFVVQDGASWADTIIGSAQLTGLVGYSAWCDEAGIFHFAPTAQAQNLTEPVEPVYTFEAGTDLLALDQDTDQYTLATRVKARGPLTGKALTDTWREQWRTSKFARPVGLWHDPADAGYLRVLDRGTKRMYRLRQSDRAVMSSVYLGAVISYPLGLSGDPADASVYWVLNAPWKYTGSASGNSVKKVRKSDNHVLATYSIPNGRWSALKVSTGHLWLTNLDTDRFYQRSKTDGSAVADFSHTYASVVQANPSGIMVDGSILYVFWSNGGTTARFLRCTTSAPGTVAGVVETVGTVLHGGEMDTVTHQHCYGDSDSLGLVAKFVLVDAVDQTSQVAVEVVDTDLEDELGAYAQLGDREHDTHPADADHPYEVRRLTLDLKVVTSLTQATETAQRQLELAAQRRRVMDAGVIGNPALQKSDPVAVVDPVTGVAEAYVIDTLRLLMDASGTYLGTVALLPVAPLDDEPTDEGDASE